MAINKTIYENWIDGYKYYGRYVNERTINYVSKYMTKKDEDNPEYTGKVLCSPGLDAGYRDWETQMGWRKNNYYI